MKRPMSNAIAVAKQEGWGPRTSGRFPPPHLRRHLPVKWVAQTYRQRHPCRLIEFRPRERDRQDTERFARFTKSGSLPIAPIATVSRLASQNNMAARDFSAALAVRSWTILWRN